MAIDGSSDRTALMGIVANPGAIDFAPVAAAQVAAAPMRVEIQIEGSEVLFSGSGKYHRIFRFVISAAGVKEAIEFRYSDLRAMHLQVGPPDCGFPSRHIFRNMNTKANAATRSSELHTYLWTLLNTADALLGGAITTNAQIHRALCCSPSLAAALTAVGSERQQKAARLQQEAAAKAAAIRQQQLADRDFAQLVNHQQPSVPGLPVTMVCPRALTFQLKNRMFSWRDAVDVTGPGGLPWFKMVRSTPLFLFRDTQVITNLAGEPLLVLKKQFRWMHYEYRLERVTRNAELVPLAVITREPQFLSAATYAIQLNSQHSAGQIGCQGRWRDRFTFYEKHGVPGVPSCVVNWRGIFSLRDTFDVAVEANTDVLLYMGIACAIDHIHHEIEKASRR